jgi:hypothetical protein
MKRTDEQKQLLLACAAAAENTTSALAAAGTLCVYAEANFINPGVALLISSACMAELSAAYTRLASDLPSGDMYAVRRRVQWGAARLGQASALAPSGVAQSATFLCPCASDRSRAPKPARRASRSGVSRRPVVPHASSAGALAGPGALHPDPAGAAHECGASQSALVQLSASPSFREQTE